MITKQTNQDNSLDITAYIYLLPFYTVCILPYIFVDSKKRTFHDLWQVLLFLWQKNQGNSL